MSNDNDIKVIDLTCNSCGATMSFENKIEENIKVELSGDKIVFLNPIVDDYVKFKCEHCGKSAMMWKPANLTKKANKNNPSFSNISNNEVSASGKSIAIGNIFIGSMEGSSLIIGNNNRKNNG